MTLTETQIATNEGIAKADAGADQDWKDRADVIIRKVARENEVFSGDDIWNAGLDYPREPRALGPRIRIAVRDGVMEKSGQIHYSEIPTTHGTPQTLWKSLTYVG